MAFRIAVAADRLRWRWERLAGGFLEVFRQGNVFLGALCFGAFLMLVAVAAAELVLVGLVASLVFLEPVGRLG